MNEFVGKHVVVVGASSGLGEALVNQFVQEGSNIYALSRTIDAKEFDKSVHKIVCDITNPRQVIHTFDEIEQTAHAIDIVITTVGVGLVKNFTDTSDQETEQLMRIGLFGPMYVAREAYKRMIPYKRGIIVTVSSTTGLEGKPNEVVYSAVKQGLRGMSQALNKEASHYGIEALCLFPGGMRSKNFWNKALPENNIDGFMDPADVATKIVDMLREATHPAEFVIRRQA